ncbi:hypothetical protein EVAR_62189_1 [Eumeta japonica]|uniref:Uncharacterized protein n=1 Tax=Eumeta variegata TaxID=151549 RepID=A0A4C1Z0L5_EUMVA|nr:hypothetical protein EVAR_62189_1 [Eumeta japonica]
MNAFSWRDIESSRKFGIPKVRYCAIWNVCTFYLAELRKEFHKRDIGYSTNMYQCMADVNGASSSGIVALPRPLVPQTATSRCGDVHCGTSKTISKTFSLRSFM